MRLLNSTHIVLFGNLHLSVGLQPQVEVLSLCKLLVDCDHLSRQVLELSLSGGELTPLVKDDGYRPVT